MAELFFIATTIFVAYVVFTVMGGKKEIQKAEVTKPEAIINTDKTPPQTTPHPAPTPAPRKTATKTSSTTIADSLKNPKTGEISKVPANYAFAKRWIKDALVEEGLLDKVYKNNELNEASTAKIQTALQQLKALDKYQ